MFLDTDCAPYRRKNVRRKLNAMALEFVDKCVLLVDDSIVRGTTSKEIIQMAKDVGAKKVIVASCAPPIRLVHKYIHSARAIILKSFFDSYPNVYGIDMPSRAELVAHDRDTESIAAAIGADLVIFQTLPDLISSVRQFNSKLTTFDCSVFNGDYITGGVDEAYLRRIEGLRADNVKGKVVEGDPEVSDSKESDTRLKGGRHDRDVSIGASAPMNGADDTVGLHNSWKTN